jgi:hypothetical protein
MRLTVLKAYDELKRQGRVCWRFQGMKLRNTAVFAERLAAASPVEAKTKLQSTATWNPRSEYSPQTLYLLALADVRYQRMLTKRKSVTGRKERPVMMQGRENRVKGCATRRVDHGLDSQPSQQGQDTANQRQSRATAKTLFSALNDVNPQRGSIIVTALVMDA